MPGLRGGMDASDAIGTGELMSFTKDRTIGLQKIEELKSRAQSDEITQAEIGELLRNPDQFVRISVAKFIGEYKIEASLDLLATALDDKCEYVADAAAVALAEIGSKDALIILKNSFLSDKVARPHYLSNAISSFGREGFQVLAQCAKNPSATLRYYSARGLGSTGIKDAEPILMRLTEDKEKTSFGGLVATAANKGLKTLHRIMKNENYA
jgi:HEAT repeat protein